MPTTRGNLAQTPINSDTFNLTADLATMADSLEVLVPVASQSAGDTVATARAAAGFAVSDARPLFIYNTSTKTVQVKDSSGWRDMNGPLGIVQKKRVTGSGATWGTTITIIDNFASQLFIAGRHYRLVWALENYGGTATPTYWSCAINTCATSDGSSVTTGLTALGGYTIATANAAYGQSAVVECFYDPSVTSTLQVKFSGQVVVGTGASMSSYVCYIEDCGAAY